MAKNPGSWHKSGLTAAGATQEWVPWRDNLGSAIAFKGLHGFTQSPGTS